MHYSPMSKIRITDTMSLTIQNGLKTQAQNKRVNAKALEGHHILEHQGWYHVSILLLHLDFFREELDTTSVSC